MARNAQVDTVRGPKSPPPWLRPTKSCAQWRR